MTNGVATVPVIQPMTSSLLPSVLACHRVAFEGYLNNRLGSKYLYAFFRWFCETEDAIALCAVDGSCIAGYVVGAPLGYRKSLNRRLLLTAMSGILLRPYLIFDRRFVRRAMSRFQAFLSKEVTDDTPELPSPTYSLVGIGTHPDYRGRGVATKLIQEFEKLASIANARSVRLSVYRENDPARRLYSKSGWSYYPRNKEFADYYYKLLKSA